MDDFAKNSGSACITLVCASGTISLRVPREAAGDIMARSAELRLKFRSDEALRDLIETQIDHHLWETRMTGFVNLNTAHVVRLGIFQLGLAFVSHCAQAVERAVAVLEAGGDVLVSIHSQHVELSFGDSVAAERIPFGPPYDVKQGGVH